MKVFFEELEKKILEFWQKNRVFERSLKKKAKKGNFIFFEGPPTANAAPGFHHVLVRAIKDLICRFRTMSGFRVKRKAGWDTHGLPVEIQVEKKLGLKNKKEILDYGIEKFNQKCKESVFEFKKSWEDLTRKIGYWVDLENPYITYEKNYIESLWWILKKLWEKKLLFEDLKVVHYCPRCQTPLSLHEVAQEYKKVRDPSIFVKFKLRKPDLKDTSFLVWTTTPWTLSSNVALAFQPNFLYAKVKFQDEFFILAKERIPYLFSKEKIEIKEEFLGEKLSGFSYFAPFAKEKREKERLYEALPADFVTLEEGTGLVHLAPAFGQDDMDLIKKENEKKKEKFPIFQDLDDEGKFKEGKWKGIFAKEADSLIIKELKEKGLLFREEFIDHDYPFCWRCKSPLLYFAKKTWFIGMRKLKKNLIENNQKINWFPQHLKEGRFGEWLKEVKDWVLSRERYWATPLPVWECQKCQKLKVIGSLQELLSQKFSRNEYFFIRHGQAISNIKKIVSCWPEKIKNSLTKRGRKEVESLAEKLKKEKISLVFSSDLERTKKTAEILAQAWSAKLFFSKELREWNVGEFNGKKAGLIWVKFAQEEKDILKWTKKRARGGESPLELQKRMYLFLEKLEKRYEGKKIAIVSHEFPLTILEKTLEGKELGEILKWRFKNRKRRIKTGDFRKIDFKKIPFNNKLEIDLHRPYVDQVFFYCDCGQKMKRRESVIDCWFDSGSMPLAQVHFPFSFGKKGETLDYKELIKKIDFPADFIVEAIDQTRGWFYTLLAVSTSLGLGPAYLNVISTGHILDEKGEKMSKSKGNVVDPWDLIKRYSADTLRWYCYTINEPSESKRFREKDFENVFKNFILLLLNCWNFFNFYFKARLINKFSPKKLLDRWIISRLVFLSSFVKEKLERYEILSAGREIEKFLRNDLSLWYIRRSRSRLEGKEKKEVEKTLSFLFLNFAKILAPFCPFLAEYFYQGFLKKPFENRDSVHLKDFPLLPEGLRKKELEEKMEKILKIVSLVLAERKKKKIKLRQPLSSLKLRERIKEKELISLLKDEVNVKEIIFDEKLKEDFELDLNLTPELKREGLLRELMRNIQDLRKEKGFLPEDEVFLKIFATSEIFTLLEKEKESFLKKTKIKKIEFLKERPEKVKPRFVEEREIFLILEKINGREK
ncbi:MAG: class I tRNA ligase family protein [Minisyncoccales bacterium]